jgi:hypothetical protein
VQELNSSGRGVAGPAPLAGLTSRLTRPGCLLLLLTRTPDLYVVLMKLIVLWMCCIDGFDCTEGSNTDLLVGCTEIDGCLDGLAVLKSTTSADLFLVHSLHVHSVEMCNCAVVQTDLLVVLALVLKEILIKMM